MSPVPRSDELAAQSQIESEHRFRNKLSGAGAGLATAAAGASGVLGKIAPFLSQYIPADLAMKGINKISPRLGEFLKNGQKAGLDIESGINFIKEKFEGATAENPKEDGNVIKQYSPELHQFIEGEIQKGRSPDEAGALAQLKPEFKKHIEKLSKDHKAPFSALLKTVYGEGKKAESTRQYNARNQQKQTMMQQEEERFNQQYGQNQQQQGQGLDPSVAAILQQGQAILQQFKGQA